MLALQCEILYVKGVLLKKRRFISKNRVKEFRIACRMTQQQVAVLVCMPSRTIISLRKL